MTDVSMASQAKFKSQLFGSQTAAGWTVINIDFAIYTLHEGMQLLGMLLLY